MVFQENGSSRSFQIPLSWITRLGIAISLLLISLLASIGFFLTQKIPQHVYEPQATSCGTILSSETKLPEQALFYKIQEPKLEEREKLSPVYGETFLHLFPLTRTLPDPHLASITIENAHVSWQNHHLTCDFALQYRKQDGGNQHGKIAVLARGAQSLTGYPAGLFHDTGSRTLVDMGACEPFAVSHYREVHAEFTAQPLDDLPSVVEIFIFDKDNAPLLYHRLKVSS